MVDSDDDQPLNFGSDLSVKACIRNCLDGECCDCDHQRQESNTSAGQTSPVPYQHLTAHQSLVSIASSGQGPSQPRPIVKQYQSAQSMQYGTASNAGRGQLGTNAGYHASQGGSYQGYGTGGRGVYIAGQHPSGFSTQQSSYNQGAGANLTPYQQSMGWFRDGTNKLYNGRGEPINEHGQVIHPAASSMPQSSSSTFGFSDESFQTAPSHQSPPSGGGSYAGSGYSSSHGGKRKQKKH